MGDKVPPLPTPAKGKPSVAIIITGHVPGEKDPSKQEVAFSHEFTEYDLKHLGFVGYTQAVIRKIGEGFAAIKKLQPAAEIREMDGWERYE